MYWNDLYQLFRVGRHIGGDDKSYIHFAVAKLILGAKIEHRLIASSLFALAFHNDYSPRSEDV